MRTFGRAVLLLMTCLLLLSVLPGRMSAGGDEPSEEDGLRVERTGEWYSASGNPAPAHPLDELTEVSVRILSGLLKEPADPGKEDECSSKEDSIQDALEDWFEEADEVPTGEYVADITLRHVAGHEGADKGRVISVGPGRVNVVVSDEVTLTVTDTGSSPSRTVATFSGDRSALTLLVTFADGPGGQVTRRLLESLLAD